MKISTALRKKTNEVMIASKAKTRNLLRKISKKTNLVNLKPMKNHILQKTYGKSQTPTVLYLSHGYRNDLAMKSPQSPG